MRNDWTKRYLPTKVPQCILRRLPLGLFIFSVHLNNASASTTRPIYRTHRPSSCSVTATCRSSRASLASSISSARLKNSSPHPTAPFRIRTDPSRPACRPLVDRRAPTWSPSSPALAYESPASTLKPRHLGVPCVARVVVRGAAYGRWSIQLQTISRQHLWNVRHFQGNDSHLTPSTTMPGC